MSNDERVGGSAEPVAPPPDVVFEALREALKVYGQHRVGCPHPSCPDCRTHTMATSKTPGYSYCTRCGRGSIPTSSEQCDCGFEAALALVRAPQGDPPEVTALRLVHAAGVDGIATLLRRLAGDVERAVSVHDDQYVGAIRLCVAELERAVADMRGRQ